VGIICLGMFGDAHVINNLCNYGLLCQSNNSLHISMFMSMSMSTAHTYPCCLLMPMPRPCVNVQAACPCPFFIFIPICMPMPMLCVHAACPGRVSVLHVHAAWKWTRVLKWKQKRKWKQKMNIEMEINMKMEVNICTQPEQYVESTWKLYPLCVSPLFYSVTILFVFCLLF
jgi:hypothetical protein